MNLNDLYAKSADLPDESGLLGPDKLIHGETYRCEIVYVKAGTTKKGATSFNSKLKVIEGPLAGGEFFDGIYFSAGEGGGVFTDGQLAYNKRLFAKLQAAGVGAQFFSSNPSDETTANAIKGSKVDVKVQWQKPTADGKVFLDNTTTWTPVGDQASSYVPGGGGTVPKGY